MKKLICEAFCNSLSIRKVPLGYAVSTAFSNIDGDPILFYIIPSKYGKKWRIEDDGTQIPLIAALGVNLKKGTRREAFEALLRDYQLYWNDSAQTVYSADVDKDKIGLMAVRFIAFLLRVQDLALLEPDTVRNTFRQDAISAIHAHFDESAVVAENEPLAQSLGAFSADIVLRRRHSTFDRPVAIYLATSEEKGLQALVAKMEIEKYTKLTSRVVLLVEHAKHNPLREPTYALAQARLDGVLSFRGVEGDAMRRLDDLMSPNERLPH